MAGVIRAVRLLIGTVLTVTLVRFVWTAVSTLVRNRPQRIGNWFRDPSRFHDEVYADAGRLAVERARAEEEGWRIVSEQRSGDSIAVRYERTAPALGHGEIGP